MHIDATIAESCTKTINTTINIRISKKNQTLYSHADYEAGCFNISNNMVLIKLYQFKYALNGIIVLDPTQLNM